MTRKYTVEYFDDDQKRRTRVVEITPPAGGTVADAVMRGVLAYSINAHANRRAERVARIIRFEPLKGDA